LCEYKNTLTEVDVYDSNLLPLDADISYECSGTRCQIGKSVGGVLKTKFPQCINGIIRASAEGFEDAGVTYSTNKEGVVEIIMDRTYDVDVDLKLGSSSYNGMAIVTFSSDRVSRTIVYPEQKSVELSEGDCEVQVSIYSESNLNLAGTKKTECVEAPKSGLAGLLGATEEKCFDIDLPAQVISNALVGGGTQDYYILESELEEGEIEINAEKLPTPTDIEELQENYILFEQNGLDINFK